MTRVASLALPQEQNRARLEEQGVLVKRGKGRCQLIRCKSIAGFIVFLRFCLKKLQRLFPGNS